MPLARSKHLPDFSRGRALQSGVPILYVRRFRVCLDLHDRLNLVEVPGAKVVAIHSNVHRQGDRIVRQIAMRVSVELPSPARMMRPNLHRVMAKNDPLFADGDLGQRTPRREEMLKLSRRLVVIAVDEMDGLASQAVAICRHAVVLAETKISEKIQCVVGLHTGVQSIHNHLIHLPRICKRAIAISDDVEVSKVKVGRKPSVSHDDDYAGMNHALFVRTADPALVAKATHCAFASLSYQRGDGFGKGIGNLQSGQHCKDRFG